MKEKVKKFLQFIGNPRLLLCFALAWMITNGWSYILFAVGTYFGIGWMTALASVYLAFLWLPVSPEKLATFAISIALLRVLFPNDQKTLAVLRRFHKKAKEAIRRKKKQHEEHKQEMEKSKETDDESDRNEDDAATL